jgi:hypothetical protein
MALFICFDGKDTSFSEKEGLSALFFAQNQYFYDLRQRQTNAAKTIKSGIILLLMLLSLKPKMP